MPFAMNYCPCCGHTLEDQARFGRMRRVCPACGFVFFRDPKVAVGVLVEEGDRVLLVRRAVVPQLGLWALPAGYMEFDEEPQEAARREALEETGLNVELIGLLDVFPITNPNGRGVIIIYWGRRSDGTLRPGDDVSDARWFTAEDLPADLAFESTVAALARWRTRRERR
jgi:ADP-ribose pyrophosphatase YjhB (NUDIX family)